MRQNLFSFCPPKIWNDCTKLWYSLIIATNIRLVYRYFSAYMCLWSTQYNKKQWWIRPICLFVACLHTPSICLNRAVHSLSAYQGILDFVWVNNLKFQLIYFDANGVELKSAVTFSSLLIHLPGNGVKILLKLCVFVVSYKPAYQCRDFPVAPGS